MDNALDNRLMSYAGFDPTFSLGWDPPRMGNARKRISPDIVKSKRWGSTRTIKKK